MARHPLGSITDSERALSPAIDGARWVERARLLSGAGALVFVVVFVALHGIEPEFDPSWRMVSEYELGRHGWLMRLAFLALAVSCVAGVARSGAQRHEARAFVGRATLSLAAVGFTADLHAWVAVWNGNPRPFVWHKTADEILDNLKKYLTNL